jgi:FkbM family methyltransferase
VIKLKSESDWQVANEIFLEKDYDEAIERAILRRDRMGPVRILDLGANVGFFSLRCIDRCVNAEPRPRLELTVVEGSPSVFVDLSDRLSSHRGRGDISLTVRQALVGRRSGKGMIYSSLFHSCVNTVVREGGKTSGNIFLGRHAEDSEYLDLDELIPPPAVVDLVKCDIEGSELEFLKNYEGLLRRTRLLVIEFHPGHCNVEACHELLDAYGFYRLRTIKSHPTHSLEMYTSAASGE